METLKSLIPVNEYQTPITQELLDELLPEIKEEFLDIINNIEYIQRLISPDREYAKDRPKDEEGKIIVDIANPHILEDMDYFRQTALHYKKHGVYTFLNPNANPNSEYGKWIREERNRCWYGMIRPSDGEWITGPMYFYLNYSPIILNKVTGKRKSISRVMDFPEVWEGVYLRSHYIEQARNGGIYNDFEGGNHGAELASRGKSKSYFMASYLGRNFTLGENEEANKYINSGVTASSKQYLITDGILNKFVSIIDHCASTTQFPRKRLKNSLQDMTWKMGYKDSILDIDRGTENQVIGVSSKDDESKLRGKRFGFFGIEEFGSFARLTDLYNVLIPSVQQDDDVFGLMFLQGTAGDKDSDFAGAQEIMYNPKGYNMYALPNIYDKSSQGKRQFIYFFPNYVNRSSCYNKDGVSDVIKAIIQILKDRHRVKHNSSDPNSILKTIAERPITPSEAILKSGVNMFPVTYLSERLEQIDTNPSFYNELYSGNLSYDKSNELEYTLSSIDPIRMYPIKVAKGEQVSLEGAIEFFKLPERDKRSGKVYGNRYIAGCDTYDDDVVVDTVSLGSVYILDLWTDKIVASYTGRPQFADDFYEIARRMCLFYDARMNYENNKKGLFGYFQKMNSLYLLTDVLDFLKDKDMVKGPAYGNKSKGTVATAPINQYARMLLRNWLLTPKNVIVESENEDKEVSIANLYFLEDRALIQELIAFNMEANFDRISAMMMLMLLREDKMIMYGGDVKKKTSEDRDKDYMGNDPFFTSNYDRKISKFKDLAKSFS